MGFAWPFLAAATVLYFVGDWLGGRLFGPGASAFVFACAVSLVGGLAVALPWALRSQRRRGRT